MEIIIFDMQIILTEPYWSILGKGFQKTEKDHYYFIYFTTDEKAKGRFLLPFHYRRLTVLTSLKPTCWQTLAEQYWNAPLPC